MARCRGARFLAAVLLTSFAWLGSRPSGAWAPAPAAAAAAPSSSSAPRQQQQAAAAAAGSGPSVKNLWQRWFHSGGPQQRAAQAAALQELAAVLAPRWLTRPPVHVADLATPAGRQLVEDSVALSRRSRQMSPAQLAAAISALSIKARKLDPSLSSYPLLRRLVLAGLLHGHLGSPMAPWTTEVESALTSLCVALFRTHRAAAGYKATIEFLHVSKSGGTSVCLLAGESGCSNPEINIKRNCMVRQFDDGPRWVSAVAHQAFNPPWNKVGRPWFVRYEKPRHNVSCLHRQQYTRHKGYNFYSNEFGLHFGPGGPADARLCQQFFNVLLLRHPHQRLASHLRWISKLYTRHYTLPADQAAFFRHNNATFWSTLAPAVVDNYYVRSLLGVAAYRLPVGGVREEHLSAARCLLAQFDVLLTLEHAKQSDLLFRLGLGWNASMSGVGMHARDFTLAVQDLVAPNLLKYVVNDTLRSRRPPPPPLPVAAAAAPKSFWAGHWRRRLAQVAGQQPEQGALQAIVAGQQQQQQQQPASAALQVPLPADMSSLLAVNEYDMRLYGYGQVLQQLDGFMYDVVLSAATTRGNGEARAALRRPPPPCGYVAEEPPEGLPPVPSSEAAAATAAAAAGAAAVNAATTITRSTPSGTLISTIVSSFVPRRPRAGR